MKYRGKSNRDEGKGGKGNRGSKGGKNGKGRGHGT